MKTNLPIALALTLLLAASFRLDCQDTLKMEPNRGFRYEVNGVGGSGKYRYQANGLPAGLKMQGPVIAGIPSTSGRFSVLLNAYDEKGDFASKTINLLIGDSGVTSSSSIGKLSSSVSSGSASSSSQTFSSSSSFSSASSASHSSSSSEIRGSAASWDLQGTGFVVLGPYESNSEGYPIFRTDSNGKYIFFTNSQGEFVLPRDGQGFNIYPFNQQGNPVLPRKSNGRIVFQLNAKGLPVLPKNRFGKLVYPVDQAGASIVPVDDNGQKLYALDGNGVAILPSMTPLSVGEAFPLVLDLSKFKIATTSPTSQEVRGSTSISSTTIQTSGLSSGKSTTTSTQQTYPTGPTASYPTPRFPTGPSKDFIPSNLPMQISNYQYKVVPSRDTYQVTQLDIENQAVFTRQLNANKIVANLLSIIQSLTANLNGVQADIPGATKALNEALADQRAAQALVQSAEAANKTLTSNIETVRININQLQLALTKTKSEAQSNEQQMTTTSSQTTTINSEISDGQIRLENLVRARDQAGDSLKQSVRALDEAKDSIANSTANIQSIKKELNEAPAAKQSADNDIAKYKERISQLEEQLLKARTDLQVAQKKSDYYAALPGKASALIRQEQSFIDSQQTRISQTLQPAISRAQETVQNITTAITKIQTKIEESKTILQTNSQSISVYTRSKSQLNDKFNSLVESIATATSELNKLLSKVPAYSIAISDSYTAGNDANDKVTHLKEVVSALKEKYLISLRELNQAKAKLEKARNQKEIADIAVNEVIRKDGGPSILPYAVPDAHLVTSSTSSTSKKEQTKHRRRSRISTTAQATSNEDAADADYQDETDINAGSSGQCAAQSSREASYSSLGSRRVSGIVDAGTSSQLSDRLTYRASQGQGYDGRGSEVTTTTTTITSSGSGGCSG